MGVALKVSVDEKVAVTVWLGVSVAVSEAVLAGDGVKLGVLVGVGLKVLVDVRVSVIVAVGVPVVVAEAARRPHDVGCAADDGARTVSDHRESAHGRQMAQD